MPHRVGKEFETSKVCDYHFKKNLVNYNFSVDVSELVVVPNDMENKIR